MLLLDRFNISSWC